jgi:alpha-L-fucosidase
MHGQVEELVKNYGKIDIMWFDYSFGEYNGEKWKAKELVEMVRKYQPGIILDNRLETNDVSSPEQRMIRNYGDFETPEQGIPDVAIMDAYGNLIPWETCLTLNGNWGYSETDKNWKSPELLIHCLVNCVSKNGNMLLNVGPDPKGNIPEPSVNILTEVGKWLKKNNESIYGSGLCALSKPDWGRYTQKGNIIYAHWLYPNLGQLTVKGINPEKVKSVYMLNSGAELSFQKSGRGNSEADNLVINTGSSPEKPYQFDTVIKIELK